MASVFKFLLARPASIKWMLLATRNFHSPLASWRAVVSHTALDNSQLASVTFCDISRAFDRVWIRGLILKLKRYGIKDTLLRWLNSYLENRNQRVVLKDGISEAGNLRAGVPQGSVLSLFCSWLVLGLLNLIQIKQI